jgi:hypothetical protein
MPRPRKVQAGTYELPPPSSNGGNQPPESPYGRIVEVRAEDIPVRTISQWSPLYHELLLRLEKTPAHKALAIPFRDIKTCRSAHKCIVSMFRHHNGHKVVQAMHVVLDDGTPMLYVRRGEHWNRRRDPSDDPISSDEQSLPEEPHEQANTHQRGRRGPYRKASGG